MEGRPGRVCLCRSNRLRCAAKQLQPSPICVMDAYGQDEQMLNRVCNLTSCPVSKWISNSAFIHWLLAKLEVYAFNHDCAGHMLT